jgi:hypothetical protein
VTIAKIDVDEHKAIGEKHGIQGFPTLKWFETAAESADFEGGRNSDGEAPNGPICPRKPTGCVPVSVAVAVSAWLGHCCWGGSASDASAAGRQGSLRG